MGSVISGLISAGGAVAASNNISSAENNAINAQMTMFNESQADQAPWLSAGNTALGELLYNLTGTAPGSYTNPATGKTGSYNAPAGGWVATTPSGVAGPVTMQNYQQQPGYILQLAQGEGAMNANAASTGMLLSPQQQMALNNYAQGTAASDYQTFLNQYYQSLSPWQSMAGLGQSSATSMGNQATSTGNSVAQTIASAGSTQAALSLGMGNMLGTDLSSLLNGSSGGSLWNLITGSGGGTNPLSAQAMNDYTSLNASGGAG